MHIKFVTFHNFGPHAHFETAFKRGSIGIFGSNGKGKTHLVNGVYAALTNDFSRFDGVKADRIYDRAGPKEESFIEIVAEHEGTEFTIQRFLRPNKSELKIKGESKPIRSATEIEARLRKDLGVDMKLVDTYVFVDQWKMFSFLSHTPKERSEAFKYLCNTQKADVIFDACAELTGGSELTAEVLDNSDELVTAIGNLETTIESLETERGVCEGNLLNAKSLSTAQQLVKKRERHVELQSDLEECQAKLVEREDKLSKKSAALLKKRKSVETHRKTVDELTGAAEAAKTALFSWAQYDKRRKRKAALAATASDYVAEEDEHPEPEKPKRFDKLAEMYDSLNDLQARLSIAEEVTDALSGLDIDDNTAAVECPTCHQVVSAEFIHSQRQLLNELEEQISPLVGRIKAAEKYNKDIAAWNTWKAGFNARKQATENELLEFKGLKEPTGDKAELQQSVTLYDAGVTALENLESEVREKDKEVTKYETRVAETKEHIDKLNLRLSKTEVDDKKLGKANRRLDEHRQAELKISAIDGQLEEARRNLKVAKKNLDQLRAVIARKAKRQVVLKLLSRVKEIFHWGKLPKLVAEGNLVNMEADINASLELFGSPFWADADENLGFKVHFPGRPAHRAEGLSGGQKGVFAVAFRMAINSLFGADIGMLWLDEPTAGLDEDNVSYLEGALTHLSAEVRDKRQIVVITHADQLRTAFDQVIEL